MKHQYLTSCNCEECKLYRIEHGLTKDKHPFNPSCPCNQCRGIQESHENHIKMCPWCRGDKMFHLYAPTCECPTCVRETEIRTEQIVKEHGAKATEHGSLCDCLNCKSKRAGVVNPVPVYNIGDCDNCPAHKRDLESMKTPQHQTVLVSFKSGHYKKLEGKWKGDSIWTHWEKPDGKIIHINKDKVEYYEEL